MYNCSVFSLIRSSCKFVFFFPNCQCKQGETLGCYLKQFGSEGCVLWILIIASHWAFWLTARNYVYCRLPEAAHSCSFSFLYCSGNNVQCTYRMHSSFFVSDIAAWHWYMHKGDWQGKRQIVRLNVHYVIARLQFVEVSIS